MINLISCNKSYYFAILFYIKNENKIFLVYIGIGKGESTNNWSTIKNFMILYFINFSDINKKF